MSDSDAAEIRLLNARLQQRVSAPEFILKPAGYDVLAVARSRNDLFAMRHYDRLLVIGVHPNDVRAAVTTRRLMLEEAESLTLEQVKSHATIAHTLKGATYAGVAAVTLLKLALTYPEQGAFIKELLTERGITDPSAIEELLKQRTASPLREGTL